MESELDFLQKSFYRHRSTEGIFKSESYSGRMLCLQRNMLTCLMTLWLAKRTINALDLLQTGIKTKGLADFKSKPRKNVNKRVLARSSIISLTRRII